MADFISPTNVLDVDIGHINKDNIEQLKTINIHTLPGTLKLLMESTYFRMDEIGVKCCLLSEFLSLM